MTTKPPLGFEAVEIAIARGWTATRILAELRIDYATYKVILDRMAGITVPEPPRCGTRDGYRRHQDEATDPCWRCRKANRQHEQVLAGDRNRPAVTRDTCGTPTGYRKHRTNKERTCQTCRDAQRQHDIALRAARDADRRPDIDEHAINQACNGIYQDLRPREKRIAVQRFLAQGLTTRLIAERLHISMRTVNRIQARLEKDAAA